MMEKADELWCAAFVFYCCKEAGFEIPYRPNECRTCHPAAFLGWEEFAAGDRRIEYHRGTEAFAPEAGDIVIDNRVFENKEWGSFLRNGSIRFLPQKGMSATYPGSSSDQSANISGMFSTRKAIKADRQKETPETAAVSGVSVEQSVKTPIIRIIRNNRLLLNSSRISDVCPDGQVKLRLAP